MQSPEGQSESTTPVAATPRKRAAGKGKPPPLENTLGALSTDTNGQDKKIAKDKEKTAKAASKKRTEPLNFRVAGEFRRAFKRAAAAQDCKKVELLERIFTEWSVRNPG
jgi:hypothetical protein